MFSATHFTYDGIFSGSYGLFIADFDENSVINTSAFPLSLKTHKPPTSNRFFYNGISYESAPQYPFSVVSPHPIDDIQRRKILSWLVGRNNYKPLIIHQPDLEKYKYQCVFTDAEIIYVNGVCHGFSFTANFNSIYQFDTPSVIELNGTGVEQTIDITNNSDIIDDYVYPLVYFKSIPMENGNSISITNMTDNPQRHFIFNNLQDNEEITVDNELKYISSNFEGSKLSAFNKNWLRLRKGVNLLKVYINGTVRISCPTYVMLGF